MVLHFITSLHNGGTQNFLFRLLKNKLKDRKHIIIYLVDGVTKKQFQELKNVEIVLPFFSSIFQGYIFKSFNECHYWLYHTYIFRLFIRSKKNIAHIRGSATPKNNFFSLPNAFMFKISKIILNRLDFNLIISNSNCAINTYRSYGFSLKDAKVMYNGFMIEKTFSYVSIKNKPNIIHITRNDPAKNNKRFQKLILELDYKFCFNVNVIGEGMQDFYKNHPISINNTINISNTISFNELYKVYKKTDLVIITSLNEGLPNVLLESLSYGIPIISSDAGDCLDVLSKNPCYVSEINNIDDVNFNIFKTLNTLKDKSYSSEWSKGCINSIMYVESKSKLLF